MPYNYNFLLIVWISFGMNYFLRDNPQEKKKNDSEIRKNARLIGYCVDDFIAHLIQES